MVTLVEVLNNWRDSRAKQMLQRAILPQGCSHEAHLEMAELQRRGHPSCKDRDSVYPSKPAAGSSGTHSYTLACLRLTESLWGNGRQACTTTPI